MRAALRGSTTNPTAVTLAGWLAGDADDADARAAVRREVVERGGEFVGETDAVAAACFGVLSAVRGAFPLVAAQLCAA